MTPPMGLSASAYGWEYTHPPRLMALAINESKIFLLFFFLLHFPFFLQNPPISHQWSIIYFLDIFTENQRERISYQIPPLPLLSSSIIIILTKWIWATLYNDIFSIYHRFSEGPIWFIFRRFACFLLQAETWRWTDWKVQTYSTIYWICAFGFATPFSFF